METRTDPSEDLRILVVEDEALISEEIQVRLTRLKYQVVGSADRAAHAIELAERLRPDLILMDIRLKGPMDGIAAADLIYRHMHIPVVYLTAQSDQATFQRALATAPFGYILKPFQERDLVVAIEMAIQRHRLEQGLKESELTYATIVMGMADGVIATDLEARVCFMNLAAEALTGRKLAEARGYPLQNLLPVRDPERDSPLERLVLQVLDTRLTLDFNGECSLVGYQRVSPIEGNIAPVVDDTGKVRGVVVAFRDITERRKIEAQSAHQVELLRDNSAHLEKQQLELEKQREELLQANENLAVTNTRLLEAVDRLEALATTDGLTALKNHRAFQERLAEECQRSQRYATPLSLILLDVDKFKQYNDEFGHPAGDAALKQVAAILQACARQTDIAARYGGEEFAIILTETDRKGAIRVAERIRTAIESAAWESRALTASLGISTWNESHESPSTLIVAADQALYRSKLTGRNRSTHSAEMNGMEADNLRGEALTPYSDIIDAMMTIQTDLFTSASDQIREVMAKSYDATVLSWSRLLDMKDKETEGHSERVTEMTTRLALRVGMNPEELLYVRWGALLHDVGKMGIPDQILHKPGPLTEEEWAVMRNHTVIAYELLAPVSFLRPALDIPYSHHEKWDGTGYPQGLKGDDIPVPARLFAIVDVYDALTYDRPYRKAWPKEQALEHIRSLQGTHFDPRAVTIFLKEFASDPLPPE